MSNSFFLIKNGALVPAGSAASPTISSISDEDTGFYFSAANTLSIATGGTQRFDFSSSGLLSANAAGGGITIGAASNTTPTLLPNKVSTTTGIGANTSGNLSLIATATEVVRITSTDMTMMSSAKLILAADPSDDLEASTKRYVDDSVAAAVTGGAAGAGLTFSLGALNIGTASSGRIVVNADNIDLATIGTAGTYQSVTVDAYGRISAGLSITDLTSATAATSDEIAVASAANSFAARKVTLSSVLSAISAVSTSRTISTTAPLAGGGDLSANRTLTFSITSLVNTALTGSDEVVAADASASFAPVKRTISSLISDLSIWTATNDGAASGLDADLLDGQHGSYYAIGSRNISTTLPIAGGGDLSVDRTLSLNITGLVNTAVTSSDELVVADASAGFAPIKRTLGSALTDLGVIVGDAELTAIAGLTSAADSLPYFTGSGTAALTTLTSFGRNLIDDVDALAMRATLGLGTAATQNTGTSGNTIPFLDGTNTWSGSQTMTVSSSFGNPLALVSTNADANEGPYLLFKRNSASPANNDRVGAFLWQSNDNALTMTTMAEIGAYIDNVTTASLASTLVVKTRVAGAYGDRFYFKAGLYSSGASGGDQGVNTINATTLYEAGTSLASKYQGLDSELTAIAGLTSAADRLPYFTGSGTAALATFTTAGRNLIDDADTTAQRTTLGLGTAATQNTGTSGNTIPFLDGANTWSGNQSFTSTTTIFDLTDASATAGPTLAIRRLSASPAVSDLVGVVAFSALDDSANLFTIGQIQAQIQDPTNGSEDGSLNFTASIAGTLANVMFVGNGVLINGATGGFQGNGTLNAVTLYENGTSLASKYQGLDSELTAIAGLTSAADRLPYFTGSGTAALATFTSAGRNLIDDADTTAQRTTLGLGTAATQNTGTSGANIPFLNGANTWSADQVDTNAQGWKLATGAGSSTAPTLFPNRTYNAGISSVNAAPNGADIYIIAASAVSNTATSVAKFGALTITNYVNVTDTTSGGYYLKTGAASATVPTLIPLNTHTDTGIGSAGADTVSIIGFSTEIARYTTSAITHYASVSDTNASGYRLVTGAASSTAPTLVPNKAAATTGIGAQASGNISLIVAATEALRLDSSNITSYKNVIINTSANSALTISGAGNAGIEIGRVDGSSSSPYIDFHSGATVVDYDSRFVAAGGSGASGGGALEFFGASIYTGGQGAGWQLTHQAASSTAPTLVPNRGSTTTGIGAQASGNISLIAAGTEAVRVTSTDVSIRGSVTMTLAVDPSSALHAVTKQYVDNRKESIWVPGAGMITRTTNGAAAGTAETTTNKVMIKTLDFDASTIEYAQFQVNMPKSWNEGTMTAVFVWSHASTTTNFGVVWGIQGLAISDDDALDTAFGTAVTVTDTGGTTNDIYRTSETSAFTIGNSPAENDVVTFQVYRNATDGSDTMAIDARLHGVMLFYTTNAVTDA